MIQRVLSIAVISFVVHGGLWAEEEHPPEPVGTSVHEESDRTVFEAILPGDLVDWEVDPADAGSGTLILLVEMENESRQVLRWSLAEGGVLQRLGDSLSERAEALMVLGEAGGDVLVAAGDTVLGISDGGWVERFRSPFDVHPLRDSRGGRAPRSAALVLRSVGLLQAVTEDPGSDRLRVAWSLETPLRVDREWGGLRLESPPVSFLHSRIGAAPRLVLGPEAHGKRRVRTVLLKPSADDEPQSVEAWNMLPSAEDIEESWYVDLNEAPSLVVTSVLSEKHGVFEKKKLRVFDLEADRTRAGSGPRLEALTRSRNWYDTCAGIADVNADGLEDLVSAQPKGLGAGSLWVEAFLSLPGGGFATKPRGSEIKVEEGEICTLASDVDGDGRVDLIVVEDDTLLVFELIEAPDSKVVVGDRPRWQVAFHDLRGRPQPVSVFDSVADHVLVGGRTEGGRQAVRIIGFR